MVSAPSAERAGDSEPVLELAAAWGLSKDAPVSIVSGDCVTAVRWRHNMPEFPDVALPTNALVCMLRDARSHRHRGGRVEPASVRRGELGLVPQGSHGAWTFDAPVDVLHVYFPQPVLDGLADGAGLPPVELRDMLSLHDPVLGPLAHEIAMSLGQGPLDRLYTDTLGCAAAMRLIREHSVGRPSREVLKGGLAPWQVRRVTEFLTAHLEDEVSLDTLARLVNLSPNHFCTAFRQSIGEPPHRHLARLRIERAKSLLLDLRLSITDVALATGFGSAAHFATAFRKEVGVTPSTWRRERKP